VNAVHALASPPAPLARDVAQLTALSGVIERRPELPELVSRWLDREGLHVQPYIPSRPLCALQAWLEALEAETGYKPTLGVMPAPGGLGSEVTVSGELQGGVLTLSATTWRTVVADRPDDTLSRSGLHDAVLAEVRDDGQPHDPLTTAGHVAPPEEAPLTDPGPIPSPGGGR